VIIVIILLIIMLLEVSYLIYIQRERTPRPNGQPIFIDTSVLMDGRIVTAAQTGFIPSNLVIPTSVVSELQLLADQADAEKRSRARRGLDAISELQSIEELNVTLHEDGPLGPGGVDARLVELAIKRRGALCTIDFNLNKVASVKGVRVLNINELAGNIRMAFLPGETISLQLSQKGQGSGQAVGYLADGTMVVVDKAAGHIGETVEIEFIRSLQTAAGRMMFARLLAKQQSAQTRGEGKAGGRMVANEKTTSAQTRGEGKAGGRMVAEKQSNVETENTVADAAAVKGKRPSRNSRRSPATLETTSSSSARGRQSNRRQSKEDSLIQLVNDQQN
jgi:rRNA-processing protein FCF1